MPNTTFTKEDVQKAANNVRKRILGIAMESGGCYLTQACGSAEIVTDLYMRILNLNPSLGNPEAEPFPGVPSPTNMDYPKGSLYNGYNGDSNDGKDRLFISCCHYAAVIYAGLVEAGRMDEKALTRFNKDGWNMEMIGAEHSPGFENTAGSLGQTVSIAAGTAHAYKMLGREGRIFCMLSDGELEEGQDWECFAAASYYGLDNFYVVADVNGQQLEGWTKDNMNVEPLEDRIRAFGWEVVSVNGNSIDELEAAVATPHEGKPLFILGYTNPAQGVPCLEKLLPRHFVNFKTMEPELVAEFKAFYDQM